MAEAKIEIKVGPVSFSGEGTEKWLSGVLDKVLEKIPELANVVPAEPGIDSTGASDSSTGSAGGKKATRTLAAFLKEKNATANQTRKFLATALWLEHGGKDTLSTNDVTKALSDAKQGTLTNPSQCLANNVSQGFCDKKGKRDFYVTNEGRTEIG